jgi:hypothetical protein
MNLFNGWIVPVEWTREKKKKDGEEHRGGQARQAARPLAVAIATTSR